MKRLRRDTLRALVLVILHLAVLVVLIVSPVHEWIDQESVTGFLRRWGAWAPVGLLALCVVTPLIMMPRWPLAMAGGILYGWRLGGLLANVGSCAGAVVGLLFARYMAREFVVRRLGRHRLAFDRMTDRYGFWALIVLRAIPFSNFVATNALAGVSKIRLFPYVVASFVGMIPSSFLYAFMGKVAKRPDKGPLVLFGAVFVIFTVLTYALGRRVMERSSAGSEASRGPSRQPGEAPPPPPAPPPTSRSQN